MTGNRSDGAAPSPARAVVVHPDLRRSLSTSLAPQARLAEAVGLTRAIDLSVAHAEVLPVSRPRPATLFGKGAVDRVAELLRIEPVTVVVVDGTLSPVQQRNLERAWKCKVIDRTGLILEIFGERARTKEGSLQVELAALSYQRSRLVRSWTHLERQRGGFGFLGGPGETQLEADRRMIGERIARIKRALATVKRTRALHRQARRRVPYPVVALVGYTNAGKSTLFNRLTDAEVLVRDQLFATLDPTMRAVRLPSGRTVVLSDTVGFISDLPTDLVMAFRATLEEVREADVILHVRDISHPESEAHAAEVESVLRELGVGEAVDAGLISVLNKIDLVDEERHQAILKQAERSEGDVPASALTGEGCVELLETLDRALGQSREVVDVTVDLSDGAAISWLYDRGEVLRRRDNGGYGEFRVSLAPADLARFRSRQGTPVS